MKTTIPMKQGYMYFGTTSAEQTLEVPYPSSSVQTTTYPCEFKTMSDGSLRGQMSGRSRVSKPLTWDVMDLDIWNAICTWIEAHGMVFWVRYYDLNTGTWRIREMYCDTMSCEAYRPASAQALRPNEPRWLKNCTLNLTDIGGITVPVNQGGET